MNCNKISIIGGGNIGTLIAAELSHKAEEISVYSSRPDEWGTEIEVYNSDNELLLNSKPIKITDNLSESLDGAKYIFITIPAFMFVEIAERLEPIIKNDQIICVVPGAGGVEFAFRKLSQRGIQIIGFQRVHCIARLKKYGHAVYALGRKKRIEIASLPAHASSKICAEIEEFFSLPCVALNNYLCLTLTPSNPILHTSRLFTLFEDNDGKKEYKHNPLFYEEWNDRSSEVLLDMDDELQRLCAKIPLDLQEVVPLRKYYEQESAKEMTKKIQRIGAFKGIYTPMIKLDNGNYKPDFSSRYFVSDFDFGLKIICDIADIFNVKVGTMKSAYKWYCKVAKGDRETFKLTIDKDVFLSMYI